MWVPRSWGEIKELIGAGEESGTLDFKRGLPPTTKPANQEIAKDIAAMSVAGGVIVYGIEEDPQTLVASGIQPVVLAGARERFEQIAGTRVAPSCVIEVVAVGSPEDGSLGVIVVAVPPSPFAPHMVDERYPVRRGPTTANLSETDVSRLYERRRAMLESGGRSGRELLKQLFVSPVGEDRRPDAGTSLARDVGRMQVVFAPVGPVTHQRAPWLRDALREAHMRAASKILTMLSDTRPMALTRTATWTPYQTVGWSAGKSTSDPLAIGHDHPAQSSHAAVFAYPARLSFQATRYLRVTSGAHDGLGVESYLCAFEQEIASSMLVFAGIAGQIFVDMELVGMIHAAIELAGFGDAVSDADATDGLWGEPEYSRMQRAPASYVGATVTDLAELRDDPQLAAQRLIDPWLAAFCEDPSVWSRISRRGTTSSVP